METFLHEYFLTMGIKIFKQLETKKGLNGICLRIIRTPCVDVVCEWHAYIVIDFTTSLSLE